LVVFLPKKGMLTGDDRPAFLKATLSGGNAILPGKIHLAR